MHDTSFLSGYGSQGHSMLGLAYYDMLKGRAAFAYVKRHQH